MKGYVRQRGDRYYAVIYEGRDPVTGKERRTWHPAGTDRGAAERLAAKLAATETTRVGTARALTFGAYLTGQWLPAKKLHLATSTYRGYERNVQLHILPTLGKVSIRRLRYQQIEALYDSPLHPPSAKGWRPRLSTKSTSSSTGRSPTRCGADWSPATSPLSLEHPTTFPSTHRRHVTHRGRIAPAHAHRCRPPAQVSDLGLVRCAGVPPAYAVFLRRFLLSS